MIELSVPYSDHSIFINPDKVLTIRNATEYVKAAGAHFHIAGHVRIEFAFVSADEPYTEIVVGNIRDISNAIAAGRVR